MEVYVFSAGCTVHGFTSWDKSHSTASLEKHFLAAFFQALSLFFPLGIMQGRLRISLLIFRKTLLSPASVAIAHQLHNS